MVLYCPKTCEINRTDPSRYQPLVDALQYPIFLLDDNVRVKHVNDAAAEAFGVVRSDRITNRFRQPTRKQA